VVRFGLFDLSVLKGAEWPADFISRPDQYRGWFHSSAACCDRHPDAAPYRVLSPYGWTLDEQGRPMSKSWERAVSHRDTEKWGATFFASGSARWNIKPT